MDYLRTALPVAVELFGPAEGGHLSGLAARLIGMHYHDRVMEMLSGGRDFIGRFAMLLAGQGDEVSIEGRGADGATGVVRQSGWRLMRDVPHPPGEVFDAWVELWRGVVAAHDRRLRLDAESLAGGGAIFTVTRMPRRA
jgi:hypothetical protein